MQQITYIQPLLTACLVIIGIGVYRAVRKQKNGWIVFGLAALFAVSWPPLDWLFSRPLEMKYPVRPFPAEPAEAIVVLSSAVSPSIPNRPYPLADAETFERCEFAAWLYRRWNKLPILLSGGRVTDDEALSRTMRNLVIEAGVPADMTWTEEASRSTHENAVYSAALLRARGITRIVLVVEAQSMPRAAACFRKQGIHVIPAPCSFRSIHLRADDLLPSWKTIARNEITLHECLGLLYYRIRGWI